MKIIKYKIEVVKINKNVLLTGWAFSTSSDHIEIKVNGEIQKYKKIERQDVSYFFNEIPNALFSGFEIEIPFRKKINISFFDGKHTEQKTIFPKIFNHIGNMKQALRVLSKLRFSTIVDMGKIIKKYGLQAAFQKIKRNLSSNQEQIPALSAYEMYKLTEVSKSELKQQKDTIFEYSPKISILIPLYNTPLPFFKDMIQSVQDQTYVNWELCMADGSDEENGELQNICKRLSENNHKVIYKKLAMNKGISENTNACLGLASGEFIGLFDHDDILHPAALFEIVKCINEKGADFIYTDEISFKEKIEEVFHPHFKPDFAIDNLRAHNYICHFNVCSKKLYDEVGGFRKEYDGSQDFDMMLRISEKAKLICHVPKILYYWRAHGNSVASEIGAKPYVIESAHKAIQEHLKRMELSAEIKNSDILGIYRLCYKIQGEPLISIIIPNKDHIEDLNKCLHSIKKKSTYKNYEIIIVENNSLNTETFKYYEKIKEENMKIVKYDGSFNFSAINNLGVKHANGEYVLLLNNDVEIISQSWMEEMLMFIQRKDVGMVGAKLYYPDNTIQHAGLGIGLLTLAGHYHRNFPRYHAGYMGRLLYAQNVSGVTAACMMMKKCIYEELHGLDESFQVAFNDVDLCMKVRQKGYLIVFTPFAELYHYESKSRGNDDTSDKRERFVGEVERFQKKWFKQLQEGDPYYNKNLSLNYEDFRFKYMEDC